jgi:programmed cell death 6-interacting protein
MLNVQLAQAQACYYEMAQVRGMKAETLAKIAGQAADLYRAASRSMSDAAFADIDSVYPWSVYLRTHAASFDSASFWQMSQKAHADADAKGDGYGVEIAWLTVAENAANAAVSVVKGSTNPLSQHLDVTNTTLLAAKVRGRRQEAEKDNTTIYCNPVPPARDLPEVPRAQLAKPLALPDWSGYGSRDVFASIVPVEVRAVLCRRRGFCDACCIGDGIIRRVVRASRCSG